ncbi:MULTISPECIES: hypothetical protein [Burkholderia]|uniref:hypothetical protein n=1 Tax=Burkholderia TaxID=32008 RepID=UPI0012BA9A51|nr:MULTISPECIES: hypothetical protein [Burkholderia]MBG0876379.1 hypothetical protein [Burkholderia sp. 9775_39]MBG0885815.1 hypothetical protein [Burkholderia sp. 9773_38]
MADRAPRGRSTSDFADGGFGRQFFVAFFRFGERPTSDFPFRSLDLQFHRASDAIRQVWDATIATAFAQMPAVFTDHASPRAVIRRDKNARRTRRQMQRKV